MTTLASDSVQDLATAQRSVDLSIEVISDVICPWCWVGKRRLGAALSRLAPEITATLTWRPFELNPTMPKEGVDRRVYRSAKFGSWERSRALDAQVARSARGDGLDFRHDRMTRTPNTFDAHRVVRLAGREGKQDAVVEGLFSAYFHEGRDVGCSTVLVEVADAAGLDPVEVAAMLAGDEEVAEVSAELERAAELGTRSVPTVLVNRRPLFSGAIAPEAIAAHLRAVADAIR